MLCNHHLSPVPKCLLCDNLSLSIISVVTGPALLLLIMIARRPLAITVRKLGKDTGSLLTRPGNYRARLAVGHMVRSQVERETAQAWGAALLGVEGGSLRFQGLTLYW